MRAEQLASGSLRNNGDGCELVGIGREHRLRTIHAWPKKDGKQNIDRWARLTTILTGQDDADWG
jgi:hypothetical protein